MIISVWLCNSLLGIVLQENIERVEEDNESEEEVRCRKRLQIDESELSEQEEKEQQEAKKIRIDEGEISDEGLSRAVRISSSSSLSSLELGDDVDAAPLTPQKTDILKGNNNNNGRVSTESRQMPRRIETGIFSQIPPELLFNILKFLSSEVCRFLLYFCMA